MELIERSWIVAARLQTRIDRTLHSARGGWIGQSTVEYALVGALVVIAAAGTLSVLGGEVTTVFSRITNTLSGAVSSGH